MLLLGRLGFQYSSLRYTRDVSVEQKPLLTLDNGHICFTAVCAASSHVCSKAAVLLLFYSTLVLVVIYSQMRERNSHKRALGGQPIK